MRPVGVNMERMSVLSSTGHFVLTPADRIALATAKTPGDLDESRFSGWTEPSFEFYKGRGLSRLPSQIEDRTVQAVEFKPDMRFYLAFSALAGLSLIIALDSTSISVALSVISQYLHGSAIEAFWAGTSFLLASTIFQPIYASLSHIFGRKQITLIAVTIFLIGTLLASTAHIMLLMLVGRTVQGIGASGIIAMTNILLTDLVPLRFRGNWVGVLGAMWALGSVAGPVVGGSLAHTTTWQYIFYLNVPFIVVSFFLVWFFIRLRTVPSSLRIKLCRVDWFGSMVFVASMTAIMIPLTWAGVSYPWDSWHVIVPIGFGATGFTIFWYHEKFVSAEPVIRFVVFANRTTNIAYITTAIHGMILWCLLYYQPLYFEGVRGYAPVIAGVALFPATFTVAPMAIVAGVLTTKLGRFRRIVWAGWTMTVVGVGFLCAVDIDTQLTQVLLTDCLCGIGLGTLFPALQFQLQAASDPKHLAFAVALFSFFRGVGQTLGIAIGGNIFQNQLASRLSQQPLFANRAQELAKDATGLVVWMRSAPEGEARHVMRTAFTESMRTVYIVMAAFALVATAASLAIQHYDLNQELTTEQALIREGDDSIRESRRSEV